MIKVGLVELRVVLVSGFIDFYRAMLRCRARLCHRILSVCPSFCNV